MLNNSKQHIEKALSALLTNASMDAEGIDWASFQARRKRKKFGFWLYTTVGIGVLSFLGILIHAKFESHSKYKIQIVERIKTSGSENTEVLKELDTTDKFFKVIERTPISPKKNTQAQRRLLPSKMSRAPFIHSTTSTDYPFTRLQDLVQLKPIMRNQIYNKAAFTAKYKLDSIYGFRFNPLTTTSSIPEPFVKLGLGPSVINPSLVVTAKGINKIHKDYATIRNSGESNSVGYNMSAVYGKQFKTIAPYIGLGLSRNAVLAKYDFVYSEKPIRDLDGTILGYQSSIEEQVYFSSTHVYGLLDIPIGVEYKILSFPKTAINIVAQISPQMLISLQGSKPNEVFLNEQNPMQTADFKLNSFSTQAGISFSRKQGNIDWYIQPTYSNNFGLMQVKGLHSSKFSMFVLTFGLKK